MSFSRSCILIPLTIVFLESCVKQEAPESAPTVITLEPSDVKLKSFVVSGEVTNEGFNATKERGFVWSITNPNPSVRDNKISVGYGKGLFTQLFDNLNPNTNYFYKAFASNDKGTSYGELKTVKTADFALAKLITDPVINISATYATLQGKLTDNGGIDLIEKGFCVSKNPNPSINDIRVKSSNNDVGSFAIVLTALDPQTKYFVRAYAQNAKGISFGNELTFTTTSATIPIVGTNDFQEITQTSVRAGVEISNNGGADITEFGVCLSTNRFPTIFDRKIILGTNNSPGKMDNISGLSANTTYFLRGYAINRVGVAYGPERSFTTFNSFQAILSNGLISFYSFIGNANSNKNNSTNGKIYGATLDYDRFGNPNQSYRFNGSSDYISIDQLSLKKIISISIWVFDLGQGITSTSINPRLISTENCSGFALFNNIGDNPKGITFSTDRSGPATYFSNYEIVKNSWQHIVVTFDGNQCLFYLNGILLKKETKPNSLINGGKLFIGKSGCKFEIIEDFFAGKLDDIGIWDRVLNPDEVKYLFQNNFKP